MHQTDPCRPKMDQSSPTASKLLEAILPTILAMTLLQRNLGRHVWFYKLHHEIGVTKLLY